MKKYFYLFAAFCLAIGMSACQMPDYEYNGSKNPEYPNIALTGYSVTIFSSAMTDAQHPAFGITADREAFGSSWVTRKCTFEPSSPEISVAPYTGTVEVLKSCAMTVTATAEGTIKVTYPEPFGDKTGTTIMVLIDEDSGAVTLVNSGN